MAVNARRKMEKFRSQAKATTQANEKLKKETFTHHDLSGGGEGTVGEVDSFGTHMAKETGVQDLWNKYVVEALQQKDKQKGCQFSTTDAALFTLDSGPLPAADNLMCSGTGWVSLFHS